MVKRYIREEGSDEVRRRLLNGRCAASRLSVIEIGSAITRRTREGDLTTHQRDRILSTLERDFESFSVVELSQKVVTRSRTLLVRHPLRAGDAIQLASCLELAAQLDFPVLFAAYDERLLRAGEAEGLESVRARS